MHNSYPSKEGLHFIAGHAYLIKILDRAASLARGGKFSMAFKSRRLDDVELTFLKGQGFTIQTLDEQHQYDYRLCW